MYAGLLVPCKGTRFIPTAFAWEHTGVPSLHRRMNVGWVGFRRESLTWKITAATVVFPMTAGNTEEYR